MSDETPTGLKRFKFALTVIGTVIVATALLFGIKAESLTPHIVITFGCDAGCQKDNAARRDHEAAMQKAQFERELAASNLKHGQEMARLTLQQSAAKQSFELEMLKKRCEADMAQEEKEREIRNQRNGGVMMGVTSYASREDERRQRTFDAEMAREKEEREMRYERERRQEIIARCNPSQ